MRQTKQADKLKKSLSSYSKNINEIELEKEAHLAELTAILYRKHNGLTIDDVAYSGDEREVFNINTVEYRTYEQRMADANVFTAVLVWYEQARQVLPASFENIFDEIKTTDNEPMSFAELVLSIGGGLINFDKVKNSPALLVYTDAERVLEAQKKQKQENINRT